MEVRHTQGAQAAPLLGNNDRRPYPPTQNPANLVRWDKRPPANGFEKFGPVLSRKRSELSESQAEGWWWQWLYVCQPNFSKIAFKSSVFVIFVLAECHSFIISLCSVFKCVPWIILDFVFEVWQVFSWLVQSEIPAGTETNWWFESWSLVFPDHQVDNKGLQINNDIRIPMKTPTLNHLVDLFFG